MSDEYKVRNIDLDKMANHIRNTGGCTEEAALHLLDTIRVMRNENEELCQNVCGECSPDNYGWIFNRVEGKAACGCMTEAEPFQLLQKALELIADPVGPQSGVACAMVAKEALRAVLPLDYAE